MTAQIQDNKMSYTGKFGIGAGAVGAALGTGLAVICPPAGGALAVAGMISSITGLFAAAGVATGFSQDVRNDVKRGVEEVNRGFQNVAQEGRNAVINTADYGKSILSCIVNPVAGGMFVVTANALAYQQLFLPTVVAGIGFFADNFYSERAESTNCRQTPQPLHCWNAELLALTSQVGTVAAIAFLISKMYALANRNPIEMAMNDQASRAVLQRFYLPAFEEGANSTSQALAAGRGEHPQIRNLRPANQIVQSS